MILLIDVSGDARRAAAALAARGTLPSQILERRDLRLQGLLRLLRKMRTARPVECYIFCRQVGTQFNRFPLVLLASLTKARRIAFCDETEVQRFESPTAAVIIGTPLYLWHWLYGALAIIAFWVALAAAWLWLRVIRHSAPTSSSTRRLCYIKTDFWGDLRAGGSVTHTREFINAGCDIGYDISVFACDPLRHYQLKTGVQVIRPAPGLYDLPIFISQMEYNLRFPIAVWRKLRHTPVGGVYQRHSRNNFSGVVLSMLLKVPFLLEHNSSSSWIAKNWSGQRTSFISSLCEKLNFLGAYRITVVSETLRKDLLSRRVDPAKVIVNPNGVDPVRFGPHVDTSAVRNHLPQGKLLVGFIGVFGQWHGVLTLMRCVKYVVKGCDNAHFVIIGDGALKQEMIRILQQDDVLEQVTFAGLVKHELAPAYLNACDVLVSPHEDMADGSTFFGSPTKIFEYMATGKGIVASDVGQLEELLDDRQDALLVRQKDEVQLAEAIVRLLRDSALRERLGFAARRKAMAAFTWRQNYCRALGLPQESISSDVALCLEQDNLR